MTRRSGHKHNRLTGGYFADPVENCEIVQSKSLNGPISHLGDLCFGEAHIGLKLKGDGCAALRPCDARESRDRAGFRAIFAKRGQQSARIEGIEGQPDHPPLMGGRKATSVLASRAASPRTMT